MGLMSSILVLEEAMEAGSWHTGSEGSARAREEEATVEEGGEEGAELGRRRPRGMKAVSFVEVGRRSTQAVI
jgi:hypothetical protein